MKERKNILIVGGAGFIGSHLCERLVQEHNVICIDDYSSGREENIDNLLANPHFEFIRHDILQPLDFKEFPKVERFRLAYVGVSEIYHLASPSSPRFTNTHPVQTISTNTVGTKHVLDLALQYHAKVVFGSDAVVYGKYPESQKRAVEDFSGLLEYLDPLHYYAQSKRTAETLISAYHHIYSLETHIVRLFNIYGPHMYLDDSRMIPEWICNAMQGTDLMLPKAGEASFLYVTDAIDGLIKIMESQKSGLWNLGHPSSYTIKETVSKILEVTNSKSLIKNETDNLEERLLCEQWSQSCILPDVSKIKDETGWFPLVLLDEGLQKTYDFMKHLKAEKRLIK